jgi:hypothetical protein
MPLVRRALRGPSPQDAPKSPAYSLCLRGHGPLFGETPDASLEQDQPARDLPQRYGWPGRRGGVYPGRAQSRGLRGNGGHFPAPGRGSFVPVTVHEWPESDLASPPEVGYKSFWRFGVGRRAPGGDRPSYEPAMIADVTPEGRHRTAVGPTGRLTS